MDSYCEKIILEGVEGGLYLIHFTIHVNSKAIRGHHLSFAANKLFSHLGISGLPSPLASYAWTSHMARQNTSFCRLIGKYVLDGKVKLFLKGTR